MKIEHVALWTTQLETLKGFYETYFSAQASGAKYYNPKKQFESYFLTFPSGGARLELMRIPGLQNQHAGHETPLTGYVHLAIAVGSRQRVDELTETMRGSGINVIDGPRFTGDGYYESVVLDPDGNRVEITE